MQPKVTIITITYNLIKAGREKTFRQCVESVHHQTYKNIEHIIIDGASDDGTLDLIKEYADQNWLTCYSEPDNGIYDAMNKGLAKASGKYINFLNSDDYFCDDKAIESSVELLEQKQGDIIAGNFNVIKGKSICQKNKKVAWDKMILGIFPCHQTVFYKTELFKKYGGYNVSYIDADNMSFVMFKNNKAKFLYNEMPIVNFRKGGLSTQLDREKAKRGFVDLMYSTLLTSPVFTKKDIEFLYNRAYFALPVNEAIKLGAKLTNLGEPEWVEEYFMQLFCYHFKKMNSLKNAITQIVKAVFSLKNEAGDGKHYKIITVLGIKFKIRR